LFEKDALMEIFYIQEKKAFYNKEVAEQETVNKVKDIFTLPKEKSNNLKDYFEKLDDATDICNALDLEKEEIKSFVKEFSEVDQNIKTIEIENKNGGILSFGISKKSLVE